MDSDDDVVVLYDEGCSDNESSEADMDYIDSACSNPETKKNDSEEYTYQVLSSDEIVQHMIEFVREVNSILEMPETTTRILLHHFKWDKQKLLDRFYDGNQDKLFKEAHIVNPFKSSHKGSSSSTKQKCLPGQSGEYATEECQVCFTCLPASKLTGLECGHRFCTDCWNDYLKVKIMDEGVGQTIACVAHKCGILVDDATVMKLVRDPKVKLKYQSLITNSFVDCNKLMRWCASPGCNRAVKVQYVDSKPVTCECRLTFCFECGEKWHEPLGCAMLRQWEKKCRDDSETSNWLVAHTKDCPKCDSSIEKNGGCHHMSCRKCGHEFCWLCLQPWSSHGYERGCNVYNEAASADSASSNTARGKSKAALERYLFYSNRYVAHQASFGHEKELYASVQCKMEDIDEHHMSWAEAQFLKRAVDTLVSCRQTLMYTYGLAYYLKKNNQTAIFETNQQDLEHAVEILSGYLERDIAIENLADIKQRIIDRYVYCEARRQTLLKHVREGHEKAFWQYVGVE